MRTIFLTLIFTLLYLINVQSQCNADVEPSSAVVTCSMPEVELSALNSTGLGGVVSYQWNTTPSQSTPTILVNTAGTFTVTITDSEGCTDEASAMVTVNNIPPNASLDKSGDITCSQPEVTLTATPASGMSYSWSTGATPVSGTNTATVTSADTYFVTVTSNSNGCSSTASISVTSNAVPPAAGLTKSDDLDCAVTSVTLTATPASGMSYNWSSGATPQGGNTATVTNAGNYNVTVTSNSNGCSNVASITVTSNTTQPNAGLSASGEVTCAVNTVTLTATPANGMSYNWSSGATPVSGTNTATVTSGGNYTVTVTDNTNGCDDTANITVDQETDLPNVVITSNPFPPHLDCDVTAVTLDASNSSPQGTITYKWSTGPTSSSITANSKGDYTVTITNSANGCQNNETIEVTQNITPPTVSVNPTSAVLTCATQAISINANGSSGQGTLTYNWSTMNNGSSITVTAPNTYTVTVTDGFNGCTATGSSSISQDLSKPENVSATGTAFCNFQSGQLTGSSSTPNVTYAWTGPSGYTGSGPTPTVTVEGVYTLTVTKNSNGCVDDDTAIVTVWDLPQSGIDPWSENEYVQGFPLTFYDVSQNSPDGIIQAWNWMFFPNATPSSAQGNFPGHAVETTANGLATLNVCLEVEDGNGCKHTSCETPFINPVGPCTINQVTSMFPPPDSVCFGTEIEVVIDFDTPPQGASTKVITFFSGEGTIEQVTGVSSFSTTFEYTQSNTTYDGYVKYFQDLGASGECDLTFNFDVFSTELPDATITPLDNSPCENSDFQVEFSDMQSGVHEIITNFGGTYNISNNDIFAINTTDLDDPSSLTVSEIKNTKTGCSQVINTSAPISIDPLPVIEYSYIKPCEGGTLELITELKNGNPLASFSWFKDGQPIPNPPADPLNPTLEITNVTSSDAGDYFVEATDVNGCKGSYSDPDGVSFKAKPTPAIDGNITPCNNQFNVLYTSDNSDPNNQFTWTVDGAGVILSQDANAVYVHWNGGPGNGLVSVTEEATPSVLGDGCFGSDALNVVVSNTEALDTTEIILFYEQDPAIGNTNFFFVSLDTADCYRWGNSANPDGIPGETFRSLYLGDFPGGIEAIEEAGYWVEIWKGNCDDMSACRNRSLYVRGSDPVVIESEVEKTAITLFPNPAYQRVTVDISTPGEDQPFEFLLYDLNGKQLMKENILVASGAIRHEVDLHQLISGFYIIKLRNLNTGAQWQMPLVVQQ